MGRVDERGGGMRMDEGVGSALNTCQYHITCI